MAAARVRRQRLGVKYKWDYNSSGMAEKIPGWLERVLLPQIGDVKAEIKVVNARIDSLDQKLSSRIDNLDQKLSTKIEEVDKRFSFKIDELDKRLDVTQRLAVVEEQVKEILSRNLCMESYTAFRTIQNFSSFMWTRKPDLRNISNDPLKLRLSKGIPY